MTEITEDEIKVWAKRGGIVINTVEIVTDSQEKAYKIKQQILDGQKALEEKEEFEKTKQEIVKQGYSIITENQKLKAEIEELKRQLQK